MRQIHCPECGIKLPVMLPEPGYALIWCRSKTCKGKWVTVNIKVSNGDSQRSPAIA